MKLRSLKEKEGPVRKALLSDLQGKMKSWRKDETGKQVAHMRSGGVVPPKPDKWDGDLETAERAAGGTENSGHSGPYGASYAKGGVVEAVDAEERDADGPAYEGGVRDSASDDNETEGGRPKNEYESFAPIDKDVSDLDAEDDADDLGVDVKEGEGFESGEKTESLEDLIRSLSGIAKQRKR